MDDREFEDLRQAHNAITAREGRKDIELRETNLDIGIEGIIVAKYKFWCANQNLDAPCAMAESETEAFYEGLYAALNIDDTGCTHNFDKLPVLAEG